MRKTCSLIVADDEMIALDGLSSLPWEELGFSLEGAFSNGVEVISWCNSHLVDAALLDIRMPGPSGLELARYFQENHPDTVVVLLSAHSEFSLAQQALSYGVYRYISKPAEAEEILTLFREVAQEVARRHARSSLIRQATSVHLLRSLLNDQREKALQDRWIPTDGKVTRIGLIASWSASGASTLLEQLQIEGSIRTPRGDILFSFPEQSQLSATDLERLAQKHRVLLAVSASLYERTGAHETTLELENLLDELFYSPFWASTSLGGVGETQSLSEGQLRATKAGTLAVSALLSRSQSHAREQLQKFLATLHRLRLPRRVCIRVIGMTLYLLTQRLEEVSLITDGTGSLSGLSRKTEECTHFRQLSSLIESTLVELHTELETILVARSENERLTRVLSFLEENLGRPIGLDDAAQCAGMNSSAFSRWFKETQGVSFVEYLTTKRIHLASELLVSTDERISDIGRRVGYPNARYFASVFRRVMDLSPNEFRLTASGPSEP